MYESKAFLKPRMLNPRDPNDQWLFEWVEGKAQGYRKRFARAHDDIKKSLPGESLQASTHKWLVREILFASDAATRWRAAGYYLALMDALNLKCKSRQNARQLRLRPGTERIYRLLWRNPELTAKQVFVAMDSTYKRIRAHRKAKGRPIRANELTLNWPGFPSRVSRLKNRLRADKAAMALAVAEYGAEE